MTDYQRLAEEFAKALEKRRSIDERTHSEHHDYIRHLIAQDRRRDELIQNLKKNVLVWAVLGLLVGGWQIVTHWLRTFPWGGPGNG